MARKLLGVVMDPIENINYRKDTTLALLLAARRAGYELFYMQPQQLFLESAQPRAEMYALEVFANPDHWFTLGDCHVMDLCALDVILMRKDPPFDREYIYATYILEAAEKRGCHVVNRPQSLRDCNEKIFATEFPQCTPPLLVSRDQTRLAAFLSVHKDVIYKPLDGMGGTSIFRVKKGDQNLNVILETLTQLGQQTIMAQRFIPEIVHGDKRILVVGGNVISHCLARIPSGNDFRGNLAVGGQGVVKPLSTHDHWIAAQIAPTLVARGLLFVGLDVIGEFLTEINVTSPTCVREIDREIGSNIGDQLMAAIHAHRA